ncbi:MAG: toprim domain-containing protein [Chitinophagaceae bacterium]
MQPEKLNPEQIKEIDLVDYLDSLGFQPYRVNRQDYWYLSPLREELVPSFKINRSLNRWYDFGTGEGGSLIDFGIKYFKDSFHGFLERIQGNSFLGASRNAVPLSSSLRKRIPIEPKIMIHSVCPIQSDELIQYLKSRGIPIHLARLYVQEIVFSLYGKDHCALGFQNDAGGYEIRNAYFKGSSSPKEVSHFGEGKKIISVFEGFFSFLSFLVVHSWEMGESTDFMVLNSVSLFDRALPIFERYSTISLYLDRDKAGFRTTRKGLAMGPGFRDESCAFRPFKDFNDWLMKGRNECKTNSPIAALKFRIIGE